MPKLLQIDSCLGILSTGHISEGIAKVAMSQGWECYIAHGARYVGKSLQHTYQIESMAGEYFHYAKSLLLDAHGLGSTRATKKLVEYIKGIKPDIIQMHCIHGYYLNYRVLFEYLAVADIPIVWTQHDCWGFTGHCSYFGFANCERWKTECYDCPLLKIYPKSFIDQSKRNYHLKKQLFTSVKDMTIVSVSKWLDSIVSQSFMDKYPHIVIYNGIDTSVFKPYNELIRDKYGIKKAKYLLAVSSSWSEEKGLSDYVGLSAILPEDYCIVMVGISDDVKNSLSSSIISIPRTDNKMELAAMYTDATFVLSLSHSETFGLTVVEGMGCGTPAIVYDNTAQSEIVSTDVGYVVPDGAYHTIKDILISDEKLSSEQKITRSKACIDKARNSFDDQKQFGEYINLYNDLVSKALRGGGIFSSCINMGRKKGFE